MKSLASNDELSGEVIVQMAGNKTLFCTKIQLDRDGTRQNIGKD